MAKIAIVEVDAVEVRDLTLGLLEFLSKHNPPKTVAYMSMMQIVSGLMLGEIPPADELESILMDVAPVFIKRMWPAEAWDELSEVH